MTLVEELLQDADISLKVVFLVRDPRGIKNSRNAMDWCSADSCSNVETMCKDLYNDYQDAVDLAKKFPNRIILIRYDFEKILQSFCYEY